MEFILTPSYKMKGEVKMMNLSELIKKAVNEANDENGKKPLIVIIGTKTKPYDIYKIIHSIENSDKCEYMVQSFTEVTIENFCDYLDFSEKMNLRCKLSAIIVETGDSTLTDFFNLINQIKAPVYSTNMVDEELLKGDSNDDHERLIDDIQHFADTITEKHIEFFGIITAFIALNHPVKSLDGFFKFSFQEPKERLLVIYELTSFCISISLSNFVESDGDMSIYHFMEDLYGDGTDESTSKYSSLIMVAQYIMRNLLSKNKTDRENFESIKKFYETFSEYIFDEMNGVVNYKKYNDFLQPIIHELFPFFDK